jgi:OOP family OmpA-OmpF porin
MKIGPGSLTIAVAMLCLVARSGAVSVIDFRGVEFQEGRPTSALVLEDSVKPPTEQSFAVLKEAADTLRRYPELKIRIIGFTDDQECSGTTQCRELSKRRATLVYEWLLTHGTLSTQVLAVEGVGDQPIDFNDFEAGRQRNRRVEIQNAQFDAR